MSRISCRIYIQAYLRHCQCAWAVTNAVGCWISVEWYSVCVYKRCWKRRYWVGNMQVTWKRNTGMVLCTYPSAKSDRAGLSRFTLEALGAYRSRCSAWITLQTHTDSWHLETLSPPVCHLTGWGAPHKCTHMPAFTRTYKKQELDVNITDIRGKCHQPGITSCSFRG